MANRKLVKPVMHRTLLTAYVHAQLRIKDRLGVSADISVFIELWFSCDQQGNVKTGFVEVTFRPNLDNLMITHTSERLIGDPGFQVNSRFVRTKNMISGLDGLAIRVMVSSS